MEDAVAICWQLYRFYKTSIMQQIMYHSLVLIYKIKMDKKPDYIYQHIGEMQGRNTRQEAEIVGRSLLRDVRNM
jgi:hypothetical protein